MQRIVDIVFWLALSLWLALSIVGGIAAMAIFPEARELPISMDGYEAFILEDPVLGRQLIAGHLVERVFALAEAPRIACAVITGLALLAELALSRKPPLARLRLAALAVGAVALLAGTFWAMPGFQSQDRLYRESASRLETVQQAIDMKPQVDAAHEMASRVATLEAAAVAGLIVLSAVAQRSGSARRA
jgi:hypothetical protein